MISKPRIDKIFRECYNFLMYYDGKLPQDYDWKLIAEHVATVCGQLGEDELAAGMLSECTHELERRWKQSRNT